MLRKILFAAVGAAALFSSPAFAQSPWVLYDGYYPIDQYAQYGVPYYYPYAGYLGDLTVAVPVVTYRPVHVRVYGVTQDTPYYNVPPYAVYAPY